MLNLKLRVQPWKKMRYLSVGDYYKTAVKIEDLVRKELGVSRKKQWAAEDRVFEKIKKLLRKKP